MEITPVSMQMVVPRTTEASQVQHNLNQEVNVQQDFAMLREQARDQLKQEQVQAREQPEDGRVKEDPNGQGSRGGYSGKRRRRQADEGPEEERVAVDGLRGRNIDISF